MILFAALFAVAARTEGQQLGPADGKDLSPTAIDRVAIGTSAPDFTLARFGGGTVHLADFRGKRNVVMVFYRGYWCPYCIAQLKELRHLLDAELQKNTELLVISIDGENETRMTVSRVGADGVAPDFGFLSDPDHAVIARYGVLNPNGSRRGIPHPATFVVDRAGVVRWRDVQTDYKIRPTNDAILVALKGLAAR